MVEPVRYDPFTKSRSKDPVGADLGKTPDVVVPDVDDVVVEKKKTKKKEKGE